MRLVRFTSAGKENRTVYLNPEHVVSVEQFKNYVQVSTVAASRDGNGKAFAISQELEYVVSMLKGPE